MRIRGADLRELRESMNLSRTDVKFSYPYSVSTIALEEKKETGADYRILDILMSYKQPEDYFEQTLDLAMDDRELLPEHFQEGGKGTAVILFNLQIGLYKARAAGDFLFAIYATDYLRTKKWYDSQATEKNILIPSGTSYALEIFAPNGAMWAIELVRPSDPKAIEDNRKILSGEIWV